MSRGINCWEKLLEETFPGNRGFSVIYGEAGAGKTSFSLTLTAVVAGKSLYINTEGSPTYERAMQVGVPPNVEFSEDVDEWGIIYDILRAWNSKELVVVDSINSVFRVSASYDIEKAYRAFSFICALLKQMSKKAMILATAQVSLSGEAPSGEDVLSYYATSMIRLLREKGKEEGVVEVNGKLFGRYRITGGGFEWISCL